MKNLYGWLLCIGMVLFSPVQAADVSRLTLGIFPYYSSEKLAALHSPLKKYIDSHIDQSLMMRSAPNFKTFAKRTNEAQYDLVITAPHLARIAERNAGYRCLAITGNVSYAVFAATDDQGIQQVEDLRGKTLALPPKRAIIHQLALETLREAGLKPNEDVHLIVLNSHNGAMLAALEGQVDAAAFGLPTWKGASTEHKQQLTNFARSKEIPGFAFLTHNRIDEQVNQEIKAALFQFPETEAGQQYLKTTGLEGFIAADKMTLQGLDSYIDAMFQK